ncbi:DUF4160 domain-containing protein [Aeromonas veronii]|uniref:DUF4160 domain-containing protein n=1 Tax=Aeromonas veronii TaxID=654 RepID=UPI001115AD81|nr:DUF4160 domain-containing protein [Aeromonas veronii]
MNQQHYEFIYNFCKIVYQAQKDAEYEYRKEAGVENIFELFIHKKDKISIEIRAEDVSHNEPHLHITHSDKFDVSLSLNDFRVLAGDIDRKTLKKLMPKLNNCHSYLQEIWIALNETGDSIRAHQIISNLDF